MHPHLTSRSNFLPPAASILLSLFLASAPRAFQSVGMVYVYVAPPVPCPHIGGGVGSPLGTPFSGSGGLATWARLDPPHSEVNHSRDFRGQTCTCAFNRRGSAGRSPPPRPPCWAPPSAPPTGGYDAYGGATQGWPATSAPRLQ